MDEDPSRYEVRLCINDWLTMVGNMLYNAHATCQLTCTCTRACGVHVECMYYYEGFARAEP